MHLTATGYTDKSPPTRDWIIFYNRFLGISDVGDLIMVTVFNYYAIFLDKMSPTTVTNIVEAQFLANKIIDDIIL